MRQSSVQNSQGARRICFVHCTVNSKGPICCCSACSLYRVQAAANLLRGQMQSLRAQLAEARAQLSARLPGSLPLGGGVVRQDGLPPTLETQLQVEVEALRGELLRERARAEAAERLIDRQAVQLTVCGHHTQR
jgi:hypothetical protein